MATRDMTYITKNYEKRGGEIWDVAGELNILSAGVLNVESDGILQFYGEQVVGARARALARNTAAANTITNSLTLLSANGGSAPPVLPSEYGTLFFSIGGNSLAAEASARLFSAVPGQRLHLAITPAGGTVSAIITLYGSDAGFADVTILGSTGSDISSIQIAASAASFGWVTLQGVDDGVWAVVAGATNLLTERPSS